MYNYNSKDYLPLHPNKTVGIFNGILNFHISMNTYPLFYGTECSKAEIWSITTGISYCLHGNSSTQEVT